jgi:uncharacterized protein YciI
LLSLWQSARACQLGGMTHSTCSTIATLALLATPALAHADRGRPEVTRIATVTYSGGPQWKPNLPPDQQDLASHFAYVQRLYDAHVLLANGLLADGRGFYLFAVDEPGRLRGLVADDPAIDAGVLKVDAEAPWALAIDQLSAPPRAGGLFVLDYLPGPAWQARKPLEQQDLARHLAYVGQAAAGGGVLAGGPVDAHHGRYVIAAADARAAAAWVAADPAVLAGTVRVTITGWQAFHRQSARHEQQ